MDPLPPDDLKRLSLILQVQVSGRDKYEKIYSALEESCPGISIYGVQFLPSSGDCRVTVYRQKDMETILSKGISMDGKFIAAKEQFPTSTSVHIHDVPLFVPSSKVAAVLSEYGEVRGPVRMGTVSLSNGKTFHNGMRFANIVLKKEIPCYLKGTSPCRVWYEGQPRTCRICDSTEHQARNCSQNAQNTAQQPQYSPDVASFPPLAPSTANVPHNTSTANVPQNTSTANVPRNTSSNTSTTSATAANVNNNVQTSNIPTDDDSTTSNKSTSYASQAANTQHPNPPPTNKRQHRDTSDEEDPISKRPCSTDDTTTNQADSVNSNEGLPENSLGNSMDTASSDTPTPIASHSDAPAGREPGEIFAL